MQNQLGGKEYFYTPTGPDQNNNYQNNINSNNVQQNSAIKKHNSQQQQQQQQRQSQQQLYNQFTTPDPSQVRSNAVSNNGYVQQQNNNKDDYYLQGRSYQQSISDNNTSSKINANNQRKDEINNQSRINNNNNTPFTVANNAQQQQQYQPGIVGQKQIVNQNNSLYKGSDQSRANQDTHIPSMSTRTKHQQNLLAEEDGDDENDMLAHDGTHNIYQNIFNNPAASKPPAQQNKTTSQQEQKTTSKKNNKTNTNTIFFSKPKTQYMCKYLQLDLLSKVNILINLTDNYFVCLFCNLDEDPKQKYTLYKKADYSLNQEDVQSAEGEEEPNSPISAIISPLKSKRFLNGVQRIVPKSNVFQASNIQRKDQTGAAKLVLNSEDSDEDNQQGQGNDDDNNNNILQLSLNNSSITDNNNQNRQSLFRYDPALYQSVAGYFNPSQGAKNAFNVESILNDLHECYQNDQTKCTWLKNLINEYFSKNDRDYFQRINREISGLQGAENLGDYFMRKYSTNREKRVAGCSHAQRYPVYLGVRGDGNCFYRALIVSYIASILGNIARVCELETLIEEIQSNKVNLIELWYQGVSRNDSDLVKQTLIQQLVLLLLQMKKSQDSTEVSVLLMSFFENVSRDHDFDYSLVLLCRSMLLTAIDEYSSLSPYVEYILPDEADRTRDKIRTYKEDAEYHVISLSTEIFKVSIQIISLQKDKLGHFEFFEGLSYSPQIAKLNTQASTVNLLLADGHYDLLFDRATCLEYFPSLALFNKHQLYKEDLVCLTEDASTPPEIIAACTLRLTEYEKFLKDQEDQLIKTKVSQANLQSLYQSKIRNTYTPVNNNNSNSAQGFTMSHFPRQESLPVPELMYNPFSQESAANGTLLQNQDSNGLMSQPINHINEDTKSNDSKIYEQTPQKLDLNNRNSQSQNNGIIEVNTEATSTILESNKLNDDQQLSLQNNNNQQKLTTPNPKTLSPEITNKKNTEIFANSPNIVSPFEEQKQTFQSDSSKLQNQQIINVAQKQPSLSNLPQSSLVGGSSFYFVESDRTTLSKQQKITPMGDKLDEGTKKSLKKAEQQKSQVPVCIHAREANITVSQVICCKLSFEICYACFKTRQITICPQCKKDLLSNSRINSTAKNCKLSCKNCEQSNNNIVPLFNQVYCVKCDLPNGWK